MLLVSWIAYTVMWFVGTEGLDILPRTGRSGVRAARTLRKGRIGFVVLQTHPVLDAANIVRAGDSSVSPITAFPLGTYRTEPPLRPSGPSRTSSAGTSNQIMEKHWEKPEATKVAFNDRVEGYYHTGDLATVDENGMIAIQDRKKDIIISGGENISSIELEDTLFDHEAVGDAAVIPAPSDEWGETPKAFVVPSNGDPTDPPVSAKELTALTREQLAGYKAVRRIESVDELPTTTTGKVQKYELRQEEWDDEERMVRQG
ncbi:AMP-dependent synthetase and ligase [Natrinema sp. J7-2]|nr:AMP-dependent synthetase and ligase [Natrinema sp. J7-2]